MSRILLDENVPIGLTRRLADHEVEHALELGWGRITNGRLLAAAERAGFEVLVTADRNMSFQQNLSARRICLVVLSNNKWARVRRSIVAINEAIGSALLGQVISVELGP